MSLVGFTICQPVSSQEPCVFPILNQGNHELVWDWLGFAPSCRGKCDTQSTPQGSQGACPRQDTSSDEPLMLAPQASSDAKERLPMVSQPRARSCPCTTVLGAASSVVNSDSEGLGRQNVGLPPKSGDPPVAVGSLQGQLTGPHPAHPSPNFV